MRGDVDFQLPNSSVTVSHWEVKSSHVVDPTLCRLPRTVGRKIQRRKSPGQGPNFMELVFTNYYTLSIVN